MKLFSTFRLLSLAVGLGLATPTLTQAHDHDDHRGGDRHDGGHRGGDFHRYGRGYGGYGYRGYGGGFYGGYYDPGFGYGYGYPYYYSRPALSFSYYGGRRTNDDYSDNLSADVQHALKRRGYYGGPVDGDVGPGTRNALRHYQSDHRLDVTGRIDRDTLRSLDL